MFPGTVTERGDELESEAALKSPKTGPRKESCSVLELDALYGYDIKRPGNEMELGSWLVFLPRVDWLSSAVPGLAPEKW